MKKVSRAILIILIPIAILVLLADCGCGSNQSTASSYTFSFETSPEENTEVGTEETISEEAAAESTAYETTRPEPTTISPSVVDQTTPETTHREAAESKKSEPCEYLGKTISTVTNEFGSDYDVDSYIAPDCAYIFYPDGRTPLRFWIFVEEWSSAVDESTDLSNKVIDEVSCSGSSEKISLYSSYTNKMTFADSCRIGEYDEDFGTVTIRSGNYEIEYKFYSDNPSSGDIADEVTLRKIDY